MKNKGARIERVRMSEIANEAIIFIARFYTCNGEKKPRSKSDTNPK